MSLVRSIVTTVFPQLCIECNQLLATRRLWCAACHAKLPRVAHACNRCGQSLGSTANDVCGACLKNACAQDATIAPFWFDEPLAEQIKQLKYSARLELAPHLADILTDELRSTWFASPDLINQSNQLDLIVPIPSEPRKLKCRGFNTAALLARRLGNNLKVKVAYHLLCKHHGATSQVGKTRARRLQHSSGHYYLRPPIPFKSKMGGERKVKPLIGQHVLLVDDVLTTGATLNAAATTLAKAGARKISAACLALSP